MLRCTGQIRKSLTKWIVRVLKRCGVCWCMCTCVWVCACVYVCTHAFTYVHIQVRRDNCGLVRTMIDKCLSTILMERDPNKAENYVKNTIAALLQNKVTHTHKLVCMHTRTTGMHTHTTETHTLDVEIKVLLDQVDISELIITKQLNKTEDNMKVMMAHVVLAQKMKERDPNTAPVLGERVPYVIVKGHKGAKAFEKAEDPIYVLEHNVPIDTQWYVEHQLMNPILRLFEAISDNPKSLLTGDHTLKVKQVAANGSTHSALTILVTNVSVHTHTHTHTHMQVTATNSALSKFVTNTAKCLAPKCGVPLKAGKKMHVPASQWDACMYVYVHVYPSICNHVCLCACMSKQARAPFASITRQRSRRFACRPLPR